MNAAPPTRPIVHVVDDDASLRTALARLLTASGHEVRTYADATELLMAMPITSPGCLLLDMRMPGPNGIELQAALRRQGSTLPIVFLTGHGDVPTTVQAMKNGAVDFLTKPVQRDDLLSAIAAALAADQERRERDEDVTALRRRLDALTPREREVFQQVVSGRLNKQIAADLGLSERTIKAHRSKVMERMGAESLAELVHIAARMKRDVGNRSDVASGAR